MRNILSIIALLFAISTAIMAQTNSENTAPSDLARIYKAMDKGRKGEEIKIGVIGGSITAGTAASSESKRWTNLMADWWEVKFPDCKVTLINAGWGGTGSDIGVHRVYNDLLKQQPDFIVIEFAVNDAEGELSVKMMEGLIQQILTAENTPGVMILMLKQDNGTTAQVSHKQVGEHYAVPMVSFADLIDAQVATDGIALNTIFVDGLHPNDKGMAYIADFIKASLDSIYQTLPTSENLPTISTDLPTPIITDTYSQTYQFFPKTIVPLKNNGWDINDAGWSSNVPGNQIDFQVTGNAFSLVFTQNINADRGRAEVWVDEGEKTTIDAWMNEDWGTRYSFKLVQEGLDDGVHTLHIRVLSESSTTGNNIHIARVLAAGNVGSAAPIALTSTYEKGLVGSEFKLIGTDSFDPDGDNIDVYEWSILTKPAGSSSLINKASDSIANFIPDVAGEYLINLIVKTGIYQSVPATKKVNVRTTNSQPIAVPGNDTLSNLDKYFRFDGTKSYDADGDALTYKWVLESAPNDSKTIIMKDDSDKPQCKFDVEGEYVISLVVSDSIAFSEKSFIKVTGKEGYTKVKDANKTNQGLLIYPNPSTNEVHVQFFLSKVQPVSIEVYSIIGCRIGEMLYPQMALGVNATLINMRDFTNEKGIYLIKLTVGNETQTARFTLI
jgi:lysophospholipase L1-like esterase